MSDTVALVFLSLCCLTIAGCLCVLVIGGKWEWEAWRVEREL